MAFISPQSGDFCGLRNHATTHRRPQEVLDVGGVENVLMRSQNTPLLRLATSEFLGI